MEYERLTKREVTQELMKDCKNHVKCLVCGECVTCNLRPCRDSKEHIAMSYNLEVKRLDNNTFEVTYPNGNKAIRYHHTDIITYHPNGNIIINVNGWLTSTTKERLNNYLPSQWRINQINKIWYLANNSHSYAYKDGITIHVDGTVTGNGTDPKKLLKLDKQIKKYIEGYVKALFDGKIKKPGPGDCWGCLMKDIKTGQTVFGTDHLLDHFRERYYVPSLLINAIEVFPVSIAAKSSIGYYLKYYNQECKDFEDIARAQIKSSLRRYLRRQLGMTT